MSGFKFYYGHNGAGSQWSDEDLKETYKRDSQLQWKADRTRAIAKAYAKPSDYFTEKAKAIDDAADSASEIYKAQFRKMINAKLPGALAHERAAKMAQAYEEALRAAIELDFPSDLSDMSLDLMHGRGEAKLSGFANPKTKLGKNADN